MSQAYSDPKRETDPYSLPDVEVFYLTSSETKEDAKGWYYCYCFPGCLPDSDPVGPFDTEEAALADLREADMISYD
jgi:hypothetical protein